MATEQLQIIIKSKAEGQGAKETKKGLEAVKKAAVVAAGAFATLKTAQAAMDFAEFGAGIKRQSNALDGLAKAAGSSGAEITAAIQAASDHTIDRMTAMSAASKAMMLDVAQTPEQFERLTKVARSLGQAMGQDAAKSIDDFVTAAGRQSMQIADNLGLTIRAEQAYDRYARQLGKSADELTAVEKKQAFLNEMLVEGERKMREMGDTTDDAAADYERLDATMSDLKATAAETAATLVEQSGALDWLTPRLQELPTTIERLAIMLRAANEAHQKHGNLLLHAGAASETFENSVRRQYMAMQENVTVSEELRYAHLALSEAESDTGAKIDEVTRVSLLAADALVTQGDSQETLEKKILAAIPVVEDWRAAQEAATQAAQDAAQAHAAMAESLKGASEAQIASAAIAQLDALLEEGKITADEYRIAVQETQLAFGLADEASINLTNRLLALTEQFGSGKISAEEYDASLAHLIEINDMENAQLEKFGELLAGTTTATVGATAAAAEYGAQTETTTDTVNTSYAVVEKYRAKMEQVDQATLAAAAQFRAFREAIEAIPNEKNITVRVQEIRNVSEEFSPGANVPDITAAAGLKRMVGPGFGGQKLILAGEANEPEFVQITPLSQMRKMESNLTSSGTFDSTRGQLTLGHSALPSARGRSVGGDVYHITYNQTFNLFGETDPHELARQIKEEERMRAGGFRWLY